MSIIPDAVDPVPSSDRALIVASTILDSNHDDVVEADSTKKSNMDSNQDSGHCSPELGELPGNDVVSPTNDTCKPIESTTTARLHVDFDQEEPDKSNSSSRATIDTSSVFNAIDSNTANHVVCQSNPIAPVNVDFISSPHLVSTSPASSTSTVVKNELPVSTGTDSMSVKSDSPVQPPQSSFDKVNESTLLKSASTSSNNNAAQLSSSQAVSENIVITEITKDLPTIEFESMCIASTSGTLNVLRKPASPSSSSSLSNDFIEQSTATSPLREGYNHESVKESEDESTIQRESNAFGASSDDDDDPIENANSDDNCDIIDGIMFLNFETEKELNDFSRKQDKDSNKSSTLLAKSFGPLESRCQLTIRRRRGRGSGVSRRNQIRVLSKSVQSLGADSDANSCESPAPLPSLTRCAASTGRKPRGRKKSRLNQSELDHSNRSIITMPEPTPALLDNSFKNADLDRFLQNTFNTYDLKPEVSVNRSAMFTISSAKRETRNQKKIIESINRSYDGGFGCDEMPKLTLYDAPRDECEPVAHLPQLPNSPSVSPAPRSENPATEVRKRGRPKKNVDLTMTTPEKETISLSPKAVVKIVASTPLVSKEKKNQPPPAGSSKKRQVLSLVNRTIDPLNSIGIANPDDLFRRLVTTRQLDRRHIEENEKYVLLSMEDSYPRFALSTLDGNVVPTNTSISLEQDRPIKSEPVDSVSISTTVLLDTPTTAGLTETNLIDEAPIDSIKREPVDQSTQKATTVVKRRKSEGYIAKSLDLTSSSVLKHSKRDIRLPARYDSSNLVLGSTWEIPELNNNPVRERDPLIKRKKSMKRVKQSLANQCQDELPTLDDVAGIMCEPDEPTSLEIIKGNNIVSIKPNDCFARTVTPDLDTLKSSYKDYTRNKKDVTTNENDEFKGREPISVLSASATNRGDIVATLSSTVAGDISQAESTDTSCNVERQTKIERLKELYRALYYSNDPIRKRVCFEKMIKPRVNKKEVIEEAITTIQELQHKQQMIHKMQQLMKLWNKELQICLSNICESPVALNAHEQESIMKVITSYKKVILPTVDSLQHKSKLNLDYILLNWST